MKESINNKLENLSERLEEINHLLSSPDVIGDQNKFRTLSQEHAQLSPVVSCFNNYKSTIDDISEAKRMLEEVQEEIEVEEEEILEKEEVPAE